MICNPVFSLGDLVDIKGGKRLPKGVSLVSSKNDGVDIQVEQGGNVPADAGGGGRYLSVGCEHGFLLSMPSWR